jgi:hypothetical protein
MSFISLRNEIQSVITSMADCTYLRANPNEANIAINKIPVDDCLCIHIDRTTLTATKSRFGNYIYKIIPTEILFVYKNTRIDDKQTDIDTLINQAESKADEFFDKIIQSSVINDVVPIDDYKLDRLEGHKRFDAVLSGVLFTCDLPVSRNTYYCAT